LKSAFWAQAELERAATVTAKTVLRMREMLMDDGTTKRDFEAPAAWHRDVGCRIFKAQPES
jgi:hypothetical protein